METRSRQTKKQILLFQMMKIDATEAMLAATGLEPSPEDREALGRLYDRIKPGVEAMYDLPEARYEVPALGFRAAPKLDDWRGEEPAGS